MQNNQNFSLIFTNRHDGNLAFHVGDVEKDVITRHKQLAKRHNYTFDKLVHMQQIHSTRVHVVTKEENFYTPIKCDALVTDLYDTPLMVMVADCTPILMYDSKKGIIAAVHCGRAGAFGNILKNVVSVFSTQFHSQVEDIHLYSGAAIGNCCYEVGVEIVQEAQELGLSYAVVEKDRSYFLDIRSIIKAQIKALGIGHHNLDVTCNACDTQTYFSYRKEQQTGRFSGIIIKRKI